MIAAAIVPILCDRSDAVAATKGDKMSVAPASELEAVRWHASSHRLAYPLARSSGASGDIAQAGVIAGKSAVGVQGTRTENGARMLLLKDTQHGVEAVAYFQGAHARTGNCSVPN